MSTSLVSVIIPTYNRDSYLEEAIRSVAQQTYPSIEIIVVDDGSKQNYAEDICAKFSNCTYAYKENGGLSSARNFGIAKANGSYIAFLDDDDYWHPAKIEEQVVVLEQQLEVDLVHCYAAVVDEHSKETGSLIGPSKAKVSLRSGRVFWNALGVWVVKSPTPLIRKSVFDSGLLFDTNIKVGEDIDFYQRLFYHHTIYFIPKTLAYYRVYQDSNRLSQQAQKYVGVELKMWNNFKEMGVKNPWILRKIAIRLAKKARERVQQLGSFQKKIKPTYWVYINPVKQLSYYSHGE